MTRFSLPVAVGLYYCFSNLSDARIFIIMYGVTSMYFSAVMVRPNALIKADLIPFYVFGINEASTLSWLNLWWAVSSQRSIFLGLFAWRGNRMIQNSMVLVFF